MHLLLFAIFAPVVISSKDLDLDKENLNATVTFGNLTQGDTDVYRRDFRHLTCCMGASPQLNERLFPYLTSWEVKEEGPGVDHTGDHTGKCTRFSGYYELKPSVLVEVPERLSESIDCKCPTGGENLDRNCRHLPHCDNGGYRAYRNNLRCVCPDKYFGELCELYCYNGERVKVDEFDQCQCKEHFYGKECNKVHCFNGGTPLEGRACRCQQPYVGRHCTESLHSDTDANPGNTSGVLNRDLTGTIISLFLVIGLAVAIYFLVRRRAELAYREGSLFRIRRRRRTPPSEVVITHGYPHDTVVAGAPPAYSNQNFVLPPSQDIPSPEEGFPVRGTLPPPPTYDDALKHATVTRAVSGASTDSDVGNTSDTAHLT